MKLYTVKDGSKNIKLVQESDTKPTAVFVDSRMCLIESLINESLHSGLFGRVRSCNSIQDLLSSEDIDELDTKLVVMSLDMLNLDLASVSNRETDIDAIRSKFGSDTQLVFLTDKPSLDLVRYMAQHEINGIIPSSYSAEQAIACLKAINAGVKFIPPTLLTEYLNRPSVDGIIAKDSSKELCDSLTPRQAQVLEMLYVGRSNKYIAAELSLCESTVKVHVSEIMKRLGATSRTHASYLYNLMIETEKTSDAIETESD